jgi:hypothetical protein
MLAEEVELRDDIAILPGVTSAAFPDVDVRDEMLKSSGVIEAADTRTADNLLKALAYA